MPDTYRITVTIKSGETYESLKKGSPEMVTSFMRVMMEDGAWIYLAPDDLMKM